MPKFSEELFEIQRLFYLKEFCEQYSLSYSDELNKLADQYPGHPLVLFFQAKSAYESSDIEQRSEAAQPYLEKIALLVQKSPQDAAVLYVQGWLQWMPFNDKIFPDEEGAGTLLSQAAEAGYTPVYYEWAETFFKKGQKKQAKENLKKGLDFYGGKLRLAEIYLDEKQYIKAVFLILSLNNPQEILFAKDDPAMPEVSKFDLEAWVENTVITSYEKAKKQKSFPLIKKLAYAGSKKACEFVTKGKPLQVVHFDKKSIKTIKNKRFLRYVDSSAAGSLRNDYLDIFLGECKRGTVCFEGGQFVDRTSEEISAFFLQKLNDDQEKLNKIAKYVIQELVSPVAGMFIKFFSGNPLFICKIQNADNGQQDYVLNISLKANSLFVSVSIGNYDIEEIEKQGGKHFINKLCVCSFLLWELPLTEDEGIQLKELNFFIDQPSHAQVLYAVLNGKELSSDLIDIIKIKRDAYERDSDKEKERDPYRAALLFKAVQSMGFFQSLLALKSYYLDPLSIIGQEPPDVVVGTVLTRFRKLSLKQRYDALPRLEQVFEKDEPDLNFEKEITNFIAMIKITLSQSERLDEVSVFQIKTMAFYCGFLKIKRAFDLEVSSGNKSSAYLEEFNQIVTLFSMNHSELEAICHAIEWYEGFDVLAWIKGLVFKNIDNKVRDNCFFGEDQEIYRKVKNKEGKVLSIPLSSHRIFFIDKVFFGGDCEALTEINKIRAAIVHARIAQDRIKKAEYILVFRAKLPDDILVEPYKIYLSCTKKVLMYKIRNTAQQVIEGIITHEDLNEKTFKRIENAISKPEQKPVKAEHKKDFLALLLSRGHVQEANYDEVLVHASKIPLNEARNWPLDVFFVEEGDYRWPIAEYIDAKIKNSTLESILKAYRELRRSKSPGSDNFKEFSKTIYSTIAELSKEDTKQLSSQGNLYEKLILSSCNNLILQDVGSLRLFINSIREQIKGSQVDKEDNKNFCDALPEINKNTKTFDEDLFEKLISNVFKKIKRLNQLKGPDAIALRQLFLGIFFRVSYSWGQHLAPTNSLSILPISSTIDLQVLPQPIQTFVGDSIKNIGNKELFEDIKIAMQGLDKKKDEAEEDFLTRARNRFLGEVERGGFSIHGLDLSSKEGSLEKNLVHVFGSEVCFSQVATYFIQELISPHCLTFFKYINTHLECLVKVEKISQKMVEKDHVDGQEQFFNVAMVEGIASFSVFVSRLEVLDSNLNSLNKLGVYFCAFFELDTRSSHNKIKLKEYRLYAEEPYKSLLAVVLNNENADEDLIQTIKGNKGQASEIFHEAFLALAPRYFHHGFAEFLPEDNNKWQILQVGLTKFMSDKSSQEILNEINAIIVKCEINKEAFDAVCEVIKFFSGSDILSLLKESVSKHVDIWFKTQLGEDWSINEKSQALCHKVVEENGKFLTKKIPLPPYRVAETEKMLLSMLWGEAVQKEIQNIRWAIISTKNSILSKPSSSLAANSIFGSSSSSSSSSSSATTPAADPKGKQTMVFSQVELCNVLKQREGRSADTASSSSSSALPPPRSFRKREE